MSALRSCARGAWLSAALVALTNCSAPDRISAPEHSLGSTLGGSGALGSIVSLLSCPDQPTAQAEAAIGPEGGALQIGPHRLDVPPGALDSTVVISGVAAADSVISVQFEPEGLTFAQPARLTLSYAACPLIPSLLPKQVVYTSDALELLQLLLSSDDLLNRRVSANLDHFSRYAVAW